LPSLPTFYRLACQQAVSFPGRTAIVYRDQRLSFADICDRANRIANVLKAEGVREGDRVLWLGQNANRVLELFLACSRLGAGLCVANWRQSVAELAFVIRDIDARVIFWQQEEVGDVTVEARTAADSDAMWIRHDGDDAESYEGRIAAAAAEAGEEAGTDSINRPLLILYSAAFGGRPNGAQLSDVGLFLQMLTHTSALGIGRDNVGLVSTPMFHIVAWLDLLPTFMMGGKVAIARRTEAQALCELIHREKIVTGRLHPPIAARIAEYNADRRFDLSSFRSSLDIPGWKEMTGSGPEIGGTGQTEVAGPIVLHALGGSTPFSGRIAPFAEARVVNPDGTDAPPGKLGELWIRGASAGLGYWNRPELNAERMRGDWWRTTDLARRDADGTISFAGPMLQMVKTGGENVYPAEVEAAIKSHPAITAAAIIGTPDPIWSQIVTGIVALAPDAHLTLETLRAYLKDRIAGYKIPRALHIVQKMPMKGLVPDYAALDARFGGGNYPGQARKA